MRRRRLAIRTFFSRCDGDTQGSRHRGQAREDQETQLPVRRCLPSLLVPICPPKSRVTRTRPCRCGAVAASSQPSSTMWPKPSRRQAKPLPVHQNGATPQPRLKRGVAEDHIASVRDPEMRHGHKPALAMEPESQLVAAVEVLLGYSPDREWPWPWLSRANATPGWRSKRPSQAAPMATGLPVSSKKTPGVSWSPKWPVMATGISSPKRPSPSTWKR